jgi:uncharacterized lipoprotein YajG
MTIAMIGKHLGFDVRRTRMRNIPVKVVITIGLLLGLLATLFLVACNSPRETTISTTSTTITTSLTTLATTSSTVSGTSLPQYVKLQLAKAPKVGETVDLVMSVNSTYATTKAK